MMEGFRVVNTAGECKRLHQVEELARSAVTDIRVGAITADEYEWLGNAGTNPNGNFFWIDEHTGNALNALGLPNPGMKYYREHLPEMVRIAHVVGKRLGVNISGRGKRDDEYAQMAQLCIDCGVDTIEINLSCPNVWSDEGTQKPIASFDPKAIAAILASVRDVLPRHTSIEVDIKLSPLVSSLEKCRYELGMKFPPLDRKLAKEIASVITGAGFVHAVVSSNTLPNVYAFDEKGKPVLSTPNGLGGLSGPIIKPLSVEQNRLLGELLPSSIKRYGVGGISNGHNLKDYLETGVAGVQVGTAWMRFGSGIFSDILVQYQEIVT